MKIEIGESLFISWLRHVKECQLVQTNWKASSKWELHHREFLEKFMAASASHFADTYGYAIYKSNAGLTQLLLQAEIDILGISTTGAATAVYAIDVAFHRAGLGYGKSREEGVAIVVKKLLRTAMSLYGYFGYIEGEIIFASPKIHKALQDDLEKAILDINTLLSNAQLHFTVRLISNDAFYSKVLVPILSVADDVADTSELFMRSIQLYNMFSANVEPIKNNKSQTKRRIHVGSDCDPIRQYGGDGFEEIKIGVIAKTILQRLLESGAVDSSEIEKLQQEEYSKEHFNINHALLAEPHTLDKKDKVRYYAAPLTIQGKKYALCSQWIASDKPRLLQWLSRYNAD